MPPEQDQETQYVHRRCGFPIWQDEDGNWHHVNPGDEVMCELFGNGGMLAPLLEGEQ